MGYQDPEKRTLPWWRRPVTLLFLVIGLVVIPWAWVLLFGLVPVLLLKGAGREKQKTIADMTDVNVDGRDSSIHQESSPSPPPIAAAPIAPVENPANVEECSESTPRLEGKALLAKIRSLSDASKADIVRACGYVSRKKNGTERLEFRAFYESLVEARGLQVASRESEERLNRSSRAKRAKDNKSFHVLVSEEDSVLLTRRCARQFDLQPGDKFCIRLESGAIILDPIDPDEDAEVEQPRLASRRMHWHATVDDENNIWIPADALSDIGLAHGQRLLAELGPATIVLEPIQRSKAA